MATKTSAQSTTQVRLPQQPAANATDQPAKISEFISVLAEISAHDGGLMLQDLWTKYKELLEKLDKRDIAYKENLTELKELTQKFEDNLKDVDRLKAEKARADETSKSLEQERDEFKHSDEQSAIKLKSLTEKNAELQRSIETLQEEVKEEKKSVREGLRKVQEEAKKVEEGLQSQASLKLELRKSDEELLYYQSMSDQMVEYNAQEREKLRMELEAIFDLAHSLARGFLFQDLDIPSWTSLDWKDMAKNEVLDGFPLPLPMSNSLAAKQMRFAMGLRTLGYTLTKHVFQPIYASEKLDEAGKLLYRLAVDDHVQETYVRSVLLLAVKGERYGEDRARIAAEETVRAMEKFVPRPMREKFKERTFQVCEKALNVWSPVQHLSEFVVANLKPSPMPSEGDVLVLPGTLEKAQSSKGTSSDKGNEPTGDKSSGSKIKNGRTHHPSRRPHDLAALSPEGVHPIWPQFSTAGEDGEVIIYPALCLIPAQIEPATKELKLEGPPTRNARINTRRNSDTSRHAPLAGGRKNGNGASFLPNGNGDKSSKT